MYCPKCGTQNDDNAWKCTNCGEVLPSSSSQGPRQSPVNIPSYLPQAILCTIFCCLPFGIVAIVYAAQVNGKIASGNIAGAEEASRKARTWCWASFGTGLAIGIISLLARLAEM